jgi:Flp pilus assembly protein TadG
MTPRRPRGAAAVEFAIVSALFFTVLFGAMEMGRLLWTWNAAVEATRLGARLAVVCDIDDSTITTRMIERLPTLTTSNITIAYLDPGCTTATCTAVRVSLNNYVHDTIIPFVPMSLTLPPFSTTLRKEFMQSAGNPVCS